MNGAQQATMESTEGVLGSNATGTDARHNQQQLAGDEKDAGNVRVLSVDKVTVEKIVLESSNGSREVLLTKNETSRKLSLSKETRPSVVRRAKDERPRSTLNSRFRVSVPRDAFTSKGHADFKINVPGGQSKLPVAKYRKGDGVGCSNKRQRIRPIKFTKCSSIGSIVIEGSSWANVIAKRNKVPPKIPEKPSIKRDFNPSSTATTVSPTQVERPEDLSPKREKVIGGTVARVKQERAIERGISEDKAKDDTKNDDDTSTVGIERGNEASETPHADRCVADEIAERGDAENEFETREECASADRDAQDRLERSQTTIEDLQKNLSTRIHDSTARSYKERLLCLRANYAPRLPPLAADSSRGERLSRGFDEDFLKRHNLDKQLKIEERRPLETDLDYASDNERGVSESEDRPPGKADDRRRYCEKVTEVEKRWSGQFLDSWLQRNSSESSKSSYVEEFGSVSSRESIVEDRDARLLFDRKHSASRFAERRTSLDESKRRTPEEALEDTTVSTVDSDSCLEDRIKAVDEDIAQVANGTLTDDNDDLDAPSCTYDNEEDKVQWNGEVETVDPAIFATVTITHEKEIPKEQGISDGVDGFSNTNPYEKKGNCKGDIETVESKEKASVTSIDDKNLLIGRNDVKTGDSFAPINSKEFSDSIFVIHRAHRGKDGYANLIKEFAMEAGSSKAKKEEKQKKKLGFRRLLPAIFSPKDSRKDYKKKEQKERKRYDERHFARYQQNGNYTRSPDTMNLNEDIKRNVKLDNSLNGSIIEERLDEIKRELFPEQGPITSTPDHFLQTDDARMLRDRARTQRSYTTDSSLSSIAPDERWMDRSGQLVISPDIRKYEQRQRREEQDGRRYGQLERKHSLQEPNHGARNYWFQRNHASSGRISAPPSERYLVRPRAIHPVDRPLPEIPQSRMDLSNYENYRDEVDPCPRDGLGDYGKDVAYTADNADYQNQAGLYQNNRNVEADLIHAPQSVAAQVKITRQPIVNQTQRAPLVGRTPKYPSPGSSQKSGDYADSSCTPNSSQKSEFSPSSSKSGEYYLHSPRSSARNSPAERAFDDARERIYENGARPAISQPSDRYVMEEHVYDETPSSPCREEYSASARAADRTAENSPAKKSDLTCEQNCTSNQRSSAKGSFQQTSEDNEAAQIESKREIEKSREDYLKSHESIDVNVSPVYGQAERTPVQNVSPSKTGLTVATSPSAGPRVLARRSQPNDQILIASPKRGEIVYQTRVPRPPNEIRLCEAESPVPIADSRECIPPGIIPIEARDPYGGQDSAVPGTARSASQRAVSSSGFSKGISRPEPIYVHRKQLSPSRSNATAEVKEKGRGSDRSPSHAPYGASESRSDVDERAAWMEEQASTSRNSRNTEARQTSVEAGKGVARSPTREPPNMAREVYQQRQPAVIQQRTVSAMSASSSEGRQSSPITSQDKVYASANSLQREPTYEQGQRQPYQSQQQAARQGREVVYVQRIAGPTYTQRGDMTCVSPQSPSKRETRQHLEAYYWQQKALESQRKSAVPQPSSGLRQIDLPEVREAVYWQQLKKLDEEQQRRIYERNLMDDGMYEMYRKTRTASPAMASPNASQVFGANAMMPGSVVHGDGSYWGNAQQRTKMSPTGKLPLMQTPKGQNQPVLIVRPQQALRDRQEMSMKSAVHSREPAVSDAQRSKSASPHFHRGEPERLSLNVTRTKPDVTGTVSLRKPEIGGVVQTVEDSNDGEGRPRPHPIFKRGSLTAGESAEYGSVGPKRVSFSNQPHAGPELAAGSWPTKHGTAPEPPTRRHRSEDSTSDTDSVFSHQEQRRDQSAAYGARGAGPFPRCRMDNVCLEQEYDANRPLPPLPKDCLLIGRRGTSARNYVCRDAPRCNSEEQRACQRRQGE